MNFTKDKLFDFLKEGIWKCIARIGILVRWIVLAGATGVVLGLIGGAFARCITTVTGFRTAHPWMLYLLPIAGLAIVAMVSAGSIPKRNKSNSGRYLWRQVCTASYGSSDYDLYDSDTCLWRFCRQEKALLCSLVAVSAERSANGSKWMNMIRKL